MVNSLHNIGNGNARGHAHLPYEKVCTYSTQDTLLQAYPKMIRHTYYILQVNDGKDISNSDISSYLLNQIDQLSLGYLLLNTFHKNSKCMFSIMTGSSR